MLSICSNPFIDFCSVRGLHCIVSLHPRHTMYHKDQRTIVATFSLRSLLVSVVLFYGATASSSECGSSENYILSPEIRNVQPTAIYHTMGNVAFIRGSSDSPCAPKPQARNTSPNTQVRLSGPGASITYDFGKQVAGIPTNYLQNAKCHGGVCLDHSLPAFSCDTLCQGLGLA
jgi:hypothetical protein